MEKNKKGVIIVGWIDRGNIPDNGETVKNQLMITRLQELGVRCRQMDFKRWKRHPWVILQFGWSLLFHRNDTLVFSTSLDNVYWLMRLMKLVGWKQNMVHWVIGGALGERVKRGERNPQVLNYMNYTLVESPLMAQQLAECGVEHVMQLPNFKQIEYIPKKVACSHKSVVKFVFLSRIVAGKGCDYILEAVRKLNELGYQDRFVVDFYGSIASEYQESFEAGCASLQNVTYKGFLNLRSPSGYDTLSSYDVMLFPTYWKSEGFAGVFVDAFIAGLPIIASRWAHNERFLVEGETALFVPVHDVNSLKNRMLDCIEGRVDLHQMSIHCQAEASKYDVKAVITENLLQRIGIM